MPLRVGFIDGDVRYQRNGFDDLALVKYDVEDNGALAVSAPTQFLGNDIYFTEHLMSGARYEAALLSQEYAADYDLELRLANDTKHGGSRLSSGETRRDGRGESAL